MNSYDYDAVEFPDGDVLCKEHCDERMREASKPIFACSSWDAYPICKLCGKVFNYVNLTKLGLEVEGGSYADWKDDQ